MKKTSYNDFEFIRTLGKGAFSTVYLVRRKEDHKPYALKSITMEKLKENEQQNSVNEVRILASISHKNVIGYKEAFWNEKNKTLNIVMEYCDDGDLETKIKLTKRNKQRFEESLIWNYSIQILRGLKALHDKKILHRDLKSANIFLTKENNQCKIGDLNVSKVMKDKFIVINSQIGTPTYSSPEVWKNKPYSYKSDLWSVGCIIYEMCSLRPPFKGKNFDELCNNICNGKIEKISSRYSDKLWNLITMLLEVDANKRVDCEEILNSDLIKEKIDELSDIYMNDNYLNDDDTSMLETIEYTNLRDLEIKIPNKRKYDKMQNQLKNKNNIHENIEETIKNDSSFDEFSISEIKPINNIIRNNTYIKNNNLLLKGKKESIHIIKKIQKEGNFNNLLMNKKIAKSCVFLNYKNIFNDKNIGKLELNLSKSQKIINNKLIKTIQKDKKFKKIKNNKIFSEKCNLIKRRAKNKTHNRDNLTNNIILIPQNKIMKSGLSSLKDDIARKISQKNLPVSSYIKKPNDNPHPISNSNPKILKQNIIIKASGSKNERLQNSVKKINRQSLFDKNEKSKFTNPNPIKNPANTENFGKIKSSEIAKISGPFKKNKLKKSLVVKKNKIDIKENSLDKKLNNEKNKEYNLNSNIKNEIGNLNLIKNKDLYPLRKSKINKEKNSKNEISFDEKIKNKKNKLSDKNVDSYYSLASENIYLMKKAKIIKSNKCINKNIKLNSKKIIEIDISNKNNINIPKDNFSDSKKPVNTERNLNNNINFKTNFSQEIEISKLFNKKINKNRGSLKNFNNKYAKSGENQ